MCPADATRSCVGRGRNRCFAELICGQRKVRPPPPPLARLVSLGCRARLYVPWMDYDLSEQFHFPTPFVDPDGDLRLSTKQARACIRVYACVHACMFAEHKCRAGEPHAGMASPEPILDATARDDPIGVGLRHRASARPRRHAATPSNSTHAPCQDCIGDCSFVSSLCVTAAYERRFKKQLITR